MWINSSSVDADSNQVGIHYASLYPIRHYNTPSNRTHHRNQHSPCPKHIFTQFKIFGLINITPAKFETAADDVLLTIYLIAFISNELCFQRAPKRTDPHSVFPGKKQVPQ